MKLSEARMAYGSLRGGSVLIKTDAVLPSLRTTDCGMSSKRTFTGIRCASRIHSNVASTLGRKKIKWH